MAGQRAAQLRKVVFAPGVFTNETDRGAVNRWKSANKVRWNKGLPEKFGGFTYIPLLGENAGRYLGVCRALHDWSSLDGQPWIAVGTHSKLHLVNNARIFDITPRRKSSNLSGGIATTNGSAVVTITDNDHRAEPGDYVRFFDADAVGGITLSGNYEVTGVPSPNTFTVEASVAASGTASGGGDFSIEYDIASGLSENGELLGYGTGDYGEGTYGTPRAAGDGIQAKLRTWSLDNWGEDLVCSPSGGGLYWWDRTTGPNSRAVAVDEAPSQIQRILVNPENRILIAFGCTSLTGQPDKMLVRWCAQEDFRVWTPSEGNLAGGKRLDHGSEIITAIRTRGQNMLWTDTQLYGMEFTGDSIDVFRFTQLGACSIMGPNAAIDVNGVVYFMGVDDFFIYDGTLRVLDCDIWTEVFERFDKVQAEKVTCSSYRRRGEVRWDYEDSSGNGYYAIYNYRENCWYGGIIKRTCYHDVSRAISGTLTNPYGANNGLLYKHEHGLDEEDLGPVFLTTEDGELILTEAGEAIILEEEAGVSQVMAWHLESHDLSDGSDAFALISGMTPDYDRLSGEHLLYLKKKRTPHSPYKYRGPYTVSSTVTDLSVRARGSQIAMRLENGTQLGQDFRMGTWQASGAVYGGR